MINYFLVNSEKNVRVGLLLKDAKSHVGKVYTIKLTSIDFRAISSS